MTEITSTSELAETEWDGRSEPADVQTDMTATTKPEGGIEFFVQMHDYTKRDMEELIVEAAARVVVGNYGNNVLAKKIEERCIALVTEKADRHLASVTAEIIDQPVTPKFPFHSKGDEKPVTMRELIGLTGRAYLEARVNGAGEVSTDSWSTKPRIQHLAECYMARAFKNEIEKATNAAIAEIQREIKAKHDALIEAEKKRLRDALAKTTGAA
jgi:hypothetical protein